MSYKIINGVLHHNGKAVFAIGQSYYPSFHKAKYPVPPEGDRTGEMKKDFKAMKDMGFNFIRVAAIGDTYFEDGKVIVNTPFVHEMLAEGEKDDIAMSIRLQGYVFNLRGNKNYMMIDNEGAEQDPNIWSNFIQTSLNHEGTLSDNCIGTKAVAGHFKDFPSVVSYQIYNEPHYPEGTVNFYDYHPKTIEAYRRWLLENGHMTKDEAENYMPPRTRREQGAKMWALWRLFAQKNLADFLCNSSDYSKEAAPNIPTYTCLTPNQTGCDNSRYGVDFFECARRMDMSGFTCYFAPSGASFYKALAAYTITESSAAVYGKNGWCVELSAINKIPRYHFNRQTYASIGAGLKGIVYYQWRGDYPSEATPIPNGCGFVNYDGSKMDIYDNAESLVKLVTELSETIVNADKVRYGIGILMSDYAVYLCDAIENGEVNQTGERYNQNAYMHNFYQIYRDIIKNNYTADFVKAEHLKENTLSIKYLFVPNMLFISDEERKKVEEFQDNGGKVYEMIDIFGDIEEYRSTRIKFHVGLEMQNVLDMIEEKPLFVSDSRYIIPQTLKGNGYYTVCLTNITEPDRPIENTILTANVPASEAVFYENGKDKYQCKVKDNKIYLPKINDGGFLIVK